MIHVLNQNSGVGGRQPGPREEGLAALAAKKTLSPPLRPPPRTKKTRRAALPSPPPPLPTRAHQLVSSPLSLQCAPPRPPPTGRPRRAPRRARPHAPLRRPARRPAGLRRPRAWCVWCEGDGWLCAGGGDGWGGGHHQGGGRQARESNCGRNPTLDEQAAVFLTVPPSPHSPRPPPPCRCAMPPPPPRRPRRPTPTWPRCVERERRERVLKRGTKKTSQK